jgi:hypothetical protein
MNIAGKPVKALLYGGGWLSSEEVVRMEYWIAGIVLLVAATGYIITCRSTKK